MPNAQTRPELQVVMTNRTEQLERHLGASMPPRGRTRTSTRQRRHPTGADPAAGPVSPRRPTLLPGTAGLPVLVDALGGKDDRLADAVRTEFEKANGRIVDLYVGPSTGACSVLVEDPARPNGRLLFVSIGRVDRVLQVRGLAETLWRVQLLAQQTESAARDVLHRSTRGTVQAMLHLATVLLLKSFEAVPPDPRPQLARTARQSLQEAVRQANDELDKLEACIEREAMHATFGYYLVGMLAGMALLPVAVVVLPTLGLPEAVQVPLILSIAAGGIGSATSVMVRITRGQTWSIDSHQGPWLTLVAGFFRPWVGAVFGVALYILAFSGSVPVDVPANDEHFFTGLAFLAGFSERWAQDTIVRSAPISPSAATSRPARRRRAG